MRKQLRLVALLIVLFAGLDSPPLLNGALAQPRPLTALQRAKRIGPKPIPRWYWHWQAWRLGERHPMAHQLRPKQAPRRIPRWAWQRLHLLLLARDQRRFHVKADGYEQAISYTRRRPTFTPTREIDVASAPRFKAALANLQPGDLVEATARFTVSGETIVSRQLSSWAVVDLGSYVTFEYPGGQNFPAVYWDNPTHIRIYGGIVTTDGTGGACISSHGMQNILWWGFNVHDCGVRASAWRRSRGMDRRSSTTISRGRSRAVV